jgi:hypothetical protein
VKINVLLDARNRIVAAQAPPAAPAAGHAATGPEVRFAPSRGQRVLVLEIPAEDSQDHPRAIFSRLYVSPEGHLRYRLAAATPRR